MSAQHAPAPFPHPDLPPFVRFASALVAPTATVLYALAAWRLAADMGWAGDFFVSAGPLSRWQIWFALGLGLQFGARSLGRLTDPENQPKQTR